MDLLPGEVGTWLVAKKYQKIGHAWNAPVLPSTESIWFSALACCVWPRQCGMFLVDLPPKRIGEMPANLFAGFVGNSA